MVLLIFFIIQIIFSKQISFLGHSFNVEKKRKGDEQFLLSGNQLRNNIFTPEGSFWNGFNMSALDDYVSRPDDHYKWQELRDYYETDFVYVHMINLTSQQWLDETKVNLPIWSHYLMVIIPKQERVLTNYASMYTTGGKRGNEPKSDDEELIMNMIVAKEAGCITAVLYQTPNEPLTFFDDPKHANREEDSIIAYTWIHYMEHLDEHDYPLRLPMVKAAVRAMDAVEDFVSQKFSYKIGNWGIAGASKRGWTAWLTGAYDACHEKRISFVMPYVMSFVNMNEQVHHWFSMMNGWSFALEDYYNLNLTSWFDSDAFSSLAGIIDPYSYKERYASQSILEVMSSDDEFFTLLDPLYYWESIQAKRKYLLVIENSEHSLISSLEDLVPTSIAFVRSFLYDIELPTLSWTVDTKSGSGDIVLTTSQKPDKVQLWYSSTCQAERIDFRIVTKVTPCSFLEVDDMCVQPIFFLDKEPEALSPTSYKAHFDPLSDGRWMGYFLHATFNIDGLKYPFIAGSQGSISPFKYPFPSCKGGLKCHGKLL